MPLLPPEPPLFPDNLLESATDAQGENRWWVLHTRPRAEKALARRLYSRRVSYFLPQFQRTWRHRGRRLTCCLPLFTGYVFLYGDGLARLHALETNLIANVLHVPDQIQLYEDLNRVHSLMNKGLSLAPEDQLQPGSWVEVVRGPFAGMEGKLIQRNKMRLVVEVRFLHQGVSVELEPWMLQKATLQPAFAMG